MDSRWFKEDRELPKEEQAEAKEESRKALKNSTVFVRRLERILTELYEETLRKDEEFDIPDWQTVHVASVSRRKTLREIQKIIQL